MTRDEHAFMTAILEAPEDDTPRLVFADWLDERGTDDDRARAALIRAQCRLEYQPIGRERRTLEREVKALLKANAGRWAQPLQAAGIGHTYEFRRGFLDGLTISPTVFVRRGRELFELAPTIRSVRFPNAANELRALAASPFLARLVSADLTLMCTCGRCGIDAELRDLFKSKHAKGLRHLNVSRDRIDVDGIRALARSTVLANLTSLDLSGNPMLPEGAAALASSLHLSKLTRLNLSGNNLHVVGVYALAGAKHFRALTKLDLSSNQITADGVKALVAAPFFNQLTTLDLSRNRIGDAGARALAAVRATSKLERIELHGARLGRKANQILKGAFGKRARID
ncbi:TIGR02996 domain-containing protein [Frigoriglobus tundricola]|uniref:TIGR02996 domain-containing protein n=1 Tax=Frigoriglobus tundricola TaxID=2774151 RepID=A0A6M5Z5C0_9BACT|nr:TIGR02996 domain-containing protein [Frigoriglobus tundricola]QJX00453.1 hypothetical protein FTUN_8083 [Frigoriglobus tundricola]